MEDFDGIEGKKELQKVFEDYVSVDITLSIKDNFRLFTPMLHKVVPGMIETSHVAVPEHFAKDQGSWRLLFKILIWRKKKFKKIVILVLSFTVTNLKFDYFL